MACDGRWLCGWFRRAFSFSRGSGSVLRVVSWFEDHWGCHGCSSWTDGARPPSLILHEAGREVVGWYWRWFWRRFPRQGSCPTRTDVAGPPSLILHRLGRQVISRYQQRLRRRLPRQPRRMIPAPRAPRRRRPIRPDHAGLPPVSPSRGTKREPGRRRAARRRHRQRASRACSLVVLRCLLAGGSGRRRRCCSAEVRRRRGLGEREGEPERWHRRRVDRVLRVREGVCVSQVVPCGAGDGGLPHAEGGGCCECWGGCL